MRRTPVIICRSDKQTLIMPAAVAGTSVLGRDEPGESDALSVLEMYSAEYNWTPPFPRAVA